MTTDAWIVYDYEVDMFKGTLELCGRSDVLESYPRHVRNAIAESLLLHTRILLDILLSLDSSTDAITLKALLPGFVLSRFDELRSLYGTRDEANKLHWHLNKMLAHSTSFRADKFDYTPIMEPLRPVMQFCIDEIEGERIKRGEGQMERPEASRPGPSILQWWNASTSSGR